MNFKKLKSIYNIYSRDCFLYPWILDDSFISKEGEPYYSSPLGRKKYSFNLLARLKKPTRADPPNGTEPEWYPKIKLKDLWKVASDTIRQSLCWFLGHKRVEALPVHMDNYKQMLFTKNSEAPFICGTIDMKTVEILCKRCRLFLNPWNEVDKVFRLNYWCLTKEIFRWIKMQSSIEKI